MLDKKELKKYFRRKMSREKSGAAQIMDFSIILIMIFAILFLVVYLYSHMLTASLIIASAAAVCFFLVYSMRRNIKLDKFTQEKTKELTQKCTLEKLILLSKKDFAGFIHDFLERKGFEIIEQHTHGFFAEKGEKSYYIPFFQYHPSEKIDIKEVLVSYRTRVNLLADNLLFITTGSISEEGQKFMKKIDKGDVFFTPPKELLKGSEEQRHYPSKEEIDEFIECEVNSEKTTFDAIKKEAFKKNKHRAYIGLGFLIMLWSYFAGFKFYYPLISCFCFFLAYISYKRQKNSKSDSPSFP